VARILIIDDDNQTRELLSIFLNLSDHEVIEATNGEEGVNIYREAPTDIVIMDMVMPVKDGLEAIQELKTDFPNCKIIAVSVELGPENRLEVAKNLGAKYTLQKPFSRQELLSLVDAALRE